MGKWSEDVSLQLMLFIANVYFAVATMVAAVATGGYLRWYCVVTACIYGAAAAVWWRLANPREGK